MRSVSPVDAAGGGGFETGQCVPFAMVDIKDCLFDLMEVPPIRPLLQ